MGFLYCLQLKDLCVIFQLCEEIPCISAVVVASLSEPEPKIGYTLKAVGGSLTTIPGLSHMIDVNWFYTFLLIAGGINGDHHLNISVSSEVRVEGLETLDYLGNLQNRERYTEQGDAITFESEKVVVYLLLLGINRIGLVFCST
ncbi:hypothetical protein L1987_53108 [Smallanthus sonchifolius]|uniref:Uncharacterized protein n=1 Tax=Smallanthus sonchifolius TaxID=185202 RepID=A0ACB9EUC3_9ASTR|nr:hypothetical protein L1987_53108 [Smallanthus sonchifolius]